MAPKLADLAGDLAAVAHPEWVGHLAAFVSARARIDPFHFMNLNDVFRSGGQECV